MSFPPGGHFATPEAPPPLEVRAQEGSGQATGEVLRLGLPQQQTAPVGPRVCACMLPAPPPPLEPLPRTCGQARGHCTHCRFSPVPTRLATPQYSVKVTSEFFVLLAFINITKLQKAQLWSLVTCLGLFPSSGTSVTECKEKGRLRRQSGISSNPITQGHVCVHYFF